MKTIVNKIRLALLLGFVLTGMTVLAQANPNYEKMSISTLMFLDEMAGRISFDEPEPTIKAGQPDLILAPEAKNRRPIAKPDTIDGRVYISAFIKMTDDVITDLEGLGVKLMANLGDGLLTAYIPIDMIEQVAAIDNVTRIEVGELMEEATDLAREASNVDDLLTLSQDAQLAGLQQKYDGKDVILAIMDNGIDFQHIAFKDKNGNSRIKGAYCYDGSSVTADWTGSGTLPTVDITTSDHGTHTSSIAGGSSVIVNGTDITVTDDHAAATYGGMAPGADLYLGGFSGLNNTHMATAYARAISYADSQNKPLVVSNSWSTTAGPRDGQLGSAMEEYIQNNFGDSHPNRVCLFAASNRAGNAKPYSEGGGLYVGGVSSRTNPVGSILRYHRYSNADNGYCYNGYVFEAWGRSTTSLGITIYVLNNNTGAVLTSVSYTPTGTTTVSGLSSYYDGTLTIYTGTNSVTGKRQIRLNASNFKTKSYNYDTENNFYYSNYTLAIEVYPTSGSCYVDMWGGTIAYFTNSLTTSGHTWIQGSDDVSASDNAMWPNVISVGSYITREGGTSGNSVGDISPFSAYAIASVCPAGIDVPWISAPGQVLISAYNHLRTDRSSDPLINNTNYPYGTMQGTSMATPAAAGIVALWMQAATQCGHQLTHSEVKTIMAETAIHDYWTDSGENVTHFGNGKIDALAGIEYILRKYNVPTIIANPTEVTFDVEPGTTSTQTVTVSGLKLTGDITATLDDPDGVYSINTTNLGSGGDLIITYAPQEAGNHSATIILTSPGADPVTITITGTAATMTDITLCDGTDTNGFLPIYGYYYDAKQVNQMIYPASMLEKIKGKKIKSMKFYSSSGIKFSEGKYNVSLGTTTQSTFSSTYSRITSGMTQVATDLVAESGGTELVINIDEPFEYTDNNLVIDFEVTTAGNYGNAQTYFYGVNQSTYTSFNTQGSSKNTRGVYTGTNSGRRQFLPKVTFEFEVEVIPVTAGTVSPTDLTFNNVAIGRNSTQTVTVTNTGNQNFTPVIDTSGLPSEFTVSGNGEVLPNGSINLTVTYTPTDEGPHSGSFTVTIGETTYTVNVTGNGIVVNNTLVSNEVMVPVYKSDLESVVYNIYSANDIADDEHMELKADCGDYVKVLVKNEEAVSRYNVERKANTEDEWTVVAIATHEADNTFMPRNNDETPQGDAVAFEGDATEMWLPIQDNVPNAKTVTMYVPVTVADGKITTDNTYGAARRTRATDDISMTVHVGGSKSDKRWGGHWNQTLPNGTVADYCVYTPVISITTNDLDGETRTPYMFRAWLISEGAYNFDRDPTTTAIVGTTPLESPYLLGELLLVDVPSVQQVVIGENWDPETSPVRLQNAFGAPVNNAKIEIVVRAYYHLVNGNMNMLRDANDDTPLFRFSQQGTEGYFDLPTGIIDLFGDRQVVSVTYVNTLGMQSSQPFDGVNIVVTRYSDGSIMTSKVIR